MRSKDYGLLCHISSLYSEFGIGDLGKPAKDFIDFLSNGGFNTWEVLPLNKIDGLNCPYASTACMAQEELYIDLEAFIKKGLLKREEVDKLKSTFTPNLVNYDDVRNIKYKLLDKAFERESKQVKKQTLEYMEENPYIKDYAMYRVLSEKYGTNDWTTWPNDIAKHDKVALEKFEAENKNEMLKYAYFQKTFNEQFKSLREYAKQNNVQIVGDCAIYPNRNSVDVWANQEIFKLDEKGNPTVNGGTPGQNWGTCMYRWNDKKEEVYNWWFNRIKHDMDLYDVLRLDHYTGFCWHYEIPANKNSYEGYWAPAGGFDFFDKLFKQVDKNRVILEDIGTVSDEAYQVRDHYKLKGMCVLQWAFDGNRENGFLPHKVPRNSVYYIGTHDSTTLMGFINWANEDTIRRIHEWLWLNHRVSKEELAKRILKNMWNSNAETVILQLQDILLQDENFMMNHSGEAYGQWRYMAPKDYAEKAIKPKDLEGMFYKKISKMGDKSYEKYNKKLTRKPFEDDENTMVP